MAKDEEDDLLPDKDAAKGFYAKYEPKEILGRGISSTVRRCIEKETGKEFAAKIIDLGATTEAGETNPYHMLEATRQEISILRQVMGHPYIIDLQDVFESDAFVFLVFELCPKGELFDYLTSVVTLSEKKTRTIMRQIFEGVEYIHAKSIVHRDLKPENILLDENHNVKITDFGFARQLKDGEKLTDLCGTPGYLAPETLKCNMFEGSPGYSQEVDIWACGVIMFTLLVGCPPFWHRKQMVMLRNIMEGKYSFTSPEWADISEDPKDLIRKCLVVDPAQRITVKEVLRHPFFNQMVLMPEISMPGQPTTYQLRQQSIRSSSSNNNNNNIRNNNAAMINANNNNNNYSNSNAINYSNMLTTTSATTFSTTTTQPTMALATSSSSSLYYNNNNNNNNSNNNNNYAFMRSGFGVGVGVNNVASNDFNYYYSSPQSSYSSNRLRPIAINALATATATTTAATTTNNNKLPTTTATSATTTTINSIDIDNGFVKPNLPINMNVSSAASSTSASTLAAQATATPAKITATVYYQQQQHRYTQQQQQQQQQQQAELEQQHQQQQHQPFEYESCLEQQLLYTPNQLRKQSRFNARKKFQFAILVIRAVIRIRRLRYTAEPLHVEEAIRDPYRVKVLRKVIDGCAFRVYGHWVKKGEGQNRAALFENTPRTELHALYINNLSR